MIRRQKLKRFRQRATPQGLLYHSAWSDKGPITDNRLGDSDQQATWVKIAECSACDSSSAFCTRERERERERDVCPLRIIMTCCAFLKFLVIFLRPWATFQPCQGHGFALGATNAGKLVPAQLQISSAPLLGRRNPSKGLANDRKPTVTGINVSS